MLHGGRVNAPVLKAAVWMSGAVVSFTAMAIAGRAVSQTLDTFELMLYRSLVGIAIVVVVGLAADTLHQVNFRRVHLHLFRNIAHFCGQNLWFFAIPLIPLAQVFALEFTTPLWVMILAPFFLGERLTRMRAFAACVGFFGILLVARPDIGGISIGVMSAALAAVGFAATAILTKRLTRTESITCILFFLTTMQACFGLLCAGADGDISLPTAQTYPWLIVIGCAGLLAHFCITSALNIAPAVVVMPFDFVRLPVIAVIGMIFYEEPLNLVAILGAIIIFGASYLNIFAETRNRARVQR